MKYYVYAGYYENFISGHKLPKPYTLRDEFKTFDEALDYVWENWEDDDIFFTEDVIDDAIDNGVIDDENWKDYLMEESKKSVRKSINESINANSILSKVETIVGKTKIKHPKAEIIELDGTKYIYYSYFDRGFDDDGLDRVWDKCSDLKGVVDVGFGYGYGLENTKYENSLLIELDDDVIVESKKSARKSMKEFNEDINNTAYFDRVAGELHSWYVCYVEDYERKYEYGFKNEKECINWIKKNGFDLDPSMIESKKSARKSMKEYNYDSHNKSWVSDSVEKVYTNGLEYKNDWCTLSLYEDEYENLVNYLLDEKGFILEKKYTKKLGYDIFINEKLDLYVVIMNETTYGFFDEKHFIIRFGDELGIETPIEVAEKTLKGILFETFDLTKNDVDLIKSNVDYIILKTKEPIDKKLLDNVLNDELSKYHYPISVEVEEGKDESICIIWVS